MGMTHTPVPQALAGEILPARPSRDGDGDALAVTAPGALANRDQLDAFTDGWLGNRRLSEHTRAAYKGDVGGWLDWCRGRDLDPIAATFLHLNAWARDLETTPTHRNGRPAAPAAATTVARKLSAVSSWYAFLVKLGARESNPVTGADRPRVDRDHSATVGLTAGEVDQLLAAADADLGPARLRTIAMLELLADLGLRVGELVSLDVTDLGYEQGHRSLRFTGKGGVPRRRALTPGTVAALDAYLEQRQAVAGDPPAGPLFVTSTGKRVDRHATLRLIRRLAVAAGIPAADRLSPHSLRHAFATAARDEGVPLEDVQDAMGHADPRTTRRYDRDRHNLDRDPSYTIWAARARRRSTPPTPAAQPA